ncbi:capsid protein [Atopobacter sp. AH10]|uniref:phage minor capsid protein n=1 Tax=Atopobacter sp. AH10 TaxID=2315861 RepID=UPI000EF25B2B|nr:phage minor capsid protein [Atopobacter sp. AH10]RLK63163.1 capsid protein [Atopobacter sp. AH10]
MKRRLDHDQLEYNAEQYFLAGDKVADIYHQLQTDLFLRTVRRLTRRGTADLVRNPYIWQLEKLNDMHLLNERNIQLILKYSQVAEKELRNVIENEGFKVYQNTYDQLAEDLKRGGTTADHYEVQRALKAYSDQTFREVDNMINTSLPKETRAMYEDVVTQTVAEVATGTKSAQQALNDTIFKWFDRGFYGFTDRGGRRWQADVYARTIIKSTTYSVYREMRERPAEDLGIDTFYYSMKATAREMCAPLQHQIVTKGEAFRAEDGTQVYSLNDYGYGSPGGCMGINCGHMMTPFVVGANYKPELPDYLKNLTPEQAEENARTQQVQRAYERNIRKEKERLAVAKELKDTEQIQKSQLKLKTLESGLTKLVRGNDFLIRKKERELYYKNQESYSGVKQRMGKAIEEEYNQFNERLTQKLSKDQYRDLTSHDLKRIRKVMAENEELGKRLQLKISKQMQHIYETEDYKERVERDLNKGKTPPSYFRNVSETELHRYMLNKINMKSIFNDYQYIDVGDFDGDVLIPNERPEKADRIKVHQGKQGLHGVPNKKR